MQNHYFFSQPHQPFFVLAFVNALSTMLVFMLSFKGIFSLSIDVSTFHAYGLIYMLFTPAFLAFLFTTFPRFCATDVIAKPLYLKVFALFFTGSVLFQVGAFVSTSLELIGMFVLLIGHIWAVKILWDIFNEANTPNKDDPFWILSAMIFGVLSHVLFITAEVSGFAIKAFALEVGIYLYLFLVAFSVAQRMVPFFSHAMGDKQEGFLKLVMLLLMAHVGAEMISENLSFVADFALAFLIARELKNWELPFPNPNPLLWILHISLFWIPIAFALGALSNLITFINGTSFLFLDVHALMLGFVFTILLGFGTRVTLGHSGNQMAADRWVKNLFIGIQVVVVLRLLTSFVSSLGWNFMILFDIAVTAWLILFIAWATRFFAVLIFGKKLV